MVKLPPSFLDEALKVAEEALALAAKNSLKHFKDCPEVNSKADKSPVTAADKEAELIVRDMISKSFPDHKIVGEEFPEQGPSESEFRWLIDPIDGTLQFIRGLPRWGSLVALEYQSEVVVGAILHPVIDWGLSARKAGGCYSRHQKMSVSKVSSLNDASVVFGSIRNVSEPERKYFHGLIDQAWDDRGLGDSYGHSLVISGKAEAMIDFRIKNFDVAAVKICVEEAGGRFSDFNGEKSIESGNAISSNGSFHDLLLPGAVAN